MSNTIIVSERRRSWPDDLKRRILREAEEPGESICSVARRYEVDSGQLYQWRKKFREEAVTMTKLLPVELAGEETLTPSPADDFALATPPNLAPADPQSDRQSEVRIEIALKNGCHLFVSIDVDLKRLAQLIAALEMS